MTHNQLKTKEIQAKPLEHKSQPLAHKNIYYQRLATTTGYAIIIILIMLGIGTSGYHWLGRLPWVDSIYNAALILSGMGPVDILPGAAAKLFASVYAIVSGIVFIALIGLFLTPVFHRIMHRLHVEK